MLAIIPARGGSKGLPNKNIKMLNKKPLIAYTIEAALNSQEITRVIISTDDENIAKVAQEYGVEVPFLRPSHLAKDNSLIIDTYIYTIDQLNQEDNCNYKDVIVLLPTCPLRTSEDIDKAINIFKQKNADSVISYYEAPHPVQWYRKIDENGVLKAIFPEGDRLANRQEEEKTYLPNGAIYIFNVALLREGKYYNNKSYPYIMDADRSVDIDTLNDFEYAQFLMGKQYD